jgi:hypothetical protein
MNQSCAKMAGSVLIMLSLSVFLLSGCMYGKVKYPLDRDVAQTRLGEKTGTASAHSVAWLVSWGDAGTAGAAKNGGLRTINHLDGEYFIVLFGLYARQTTIAYGD